MRQRPPAISTMVSPAPAQHIPVTSSTSPSRTSADDVEDATPRYLDRFIVQKVLGEGSYGKVKQAIDTQTFRTVALKIIQKESLKKQSHITRLKREVRIMRLLHHPNITRLHDVMETDKEIVLVMEHVNGGELFDYIVAHKRVTEKVARKLFRQMVSALDYCHQSSVIHRDLKPENLLLDQDHNVKLIDFGFVKLFDRDDQLKTFCGSPYYASPEMILGKQYEGPEVDVWSLGVILYALVNGHLPFRDPNTGELFKKISLGAYERKTEWMSDASADLIKRLLTVEPEARATIAEIKRHPWVLAEYNCPPDALLPLRPPEIPNPSPAILSKFPLYGVDPEVAERSLALGEKGTAWALYCLLIEHEQFEKAVIDSPATSPASDEDEGSTRNSSNNGSGSGTIVAQSVPRRRSTAVARSIKRRSTDRPRMRIPVNETPIHKTALTAPVQQNPEVNPFEQAFAESDGTTQRRASVSASNVTPANKYASASARAVLQQHGDAHKSIAVAEATSGLTLPALASDTRDSVSTRDRLKGDEAPRIDLTSASRRRRPSIADALSSAFGILRAASPARRRLSSANSSNNSPSVSYPDGIPHIPSNPPRSIAARPTLSSETTSTKRPPEIVAAVSEVLQNHNVKYAFKNYKFACEAEESIFEIEICRITGTTLHALQLRRKKGSTIAYHDLCQSLVGEWKL
ncbi:kinase-like domain-containing protein [Gaertneriomyces semiglobifer]|nr:kinase-like domain-containing protein [Gaertneriomyces semiglobifer]